MWSMNSEAGDHKSEEEGNGIGSTMELWFNLLNQIVFIAQYFISLPSVLYTRLSLFNMPIFILKYMPMGLFMYKLLKDMYLKSREKIKQKQIEMEDIQLQIQIVNTKLCVRDAEFTERSEKLRRGAERLRKVRARVRDVIASDDELRTALRSAAQSDADQDVSADATFKEEDRDFLVELLSGFKYDSSPKPEKSSEKIECGEHAQTDPNTPENSVYSSLSDVDIRQDCRVKIVKITNVYKVAYLKHYIKQKRLRRATKQALLKKKIESIKTLLEDWQKNLNMVINRKLSLFNIDQHPIDLVSQEAMGDYSKTRESIDSDSDVRTSWSDKCYDEYNNNINWSQNPYKPNVYNYEEVSMTCDPKDYHDFQDYGDVKYTNPPLLCECNMMSIIEETKSQLAIEENKSEPDECTECVDHMTPTL